MINNNQYEVITDANYPPVPILMSTEEADEYFDYSSFTKGDELP